MYETPLTPTEPAPGAKAAFHLGLWSVLLNVMCGCFPVAIPLGIAALIKQGKAERAAQAEPGRYAPVANTGKVLGIVGLCLTLFAFVWMGIVSAIAIPVLLGQREKAQSRAVQAHLFQAAAELARTADEMRLTEGRNPDPEKVVLRVLAEPAMQTAQNPYGLGLRAFEKGATPIEDGVVEMDPEPGYQDPHTGQIVPSVILRARIRSGVKREVIEKIVPLD